MSEFKIPPITTLAGSKFASYFKILGSAKVAPRSYLNVFLTTLVVLIRQPFQIWEELVFHRKLKGSRMKKPPLFILGHWRSGTTLLHNLLCQDPRAAYLTTYHSTFPNNMASALVFKTFMKASMPDERPSDKVALNIDFPQEDEFAFGNMQANGYYNFFHFPSQYAAYYERAVHHRDLTDAEVDHWYRTYDELLRKSAALSSGERMIVKNPVNTARVDKLLKLYPDAKFLYIHRNPITVFYSTCRFFKQLMPTLCLEELPSAGFLDSMVLDVYDRMMQDYDLHKGTIPSGNLMEIRFEDFENAPLPMLADIHRNLLDEDPKEVLPYYEAYLRTQHSHRMNSYEVDRKGLDHVAEKLARHMQQYGYTVPENVRPVQHDPNASYP